MRLAASRNSFFRSPVGSGSGAGGIAVTAALVSLERARALLAAALSSALPERLATTPRSAPRAPAVEQHGHDHAQVVGVEGRELGLERRLLVFDLGAAVAEAVGVGGGGDELVHAARMMTRRAGQGRQPWPRTSASCRCPPRRSGTRSPTPAATATGSSARSRSATPSPAGRRPARSSTTRSASARSTLSDHTGVARGRAPPRRLRAAREGPPARHRDGDAAS